MKTISNEEIEIDASARACASSLMLLKHSDGKSMYYTNDNSANKTEEREAKNESNTNNRRT